MRTPAPHLVEESRSQRLVTRILIVLSVAALAVYLPWRLVGTLDGASLVLALALLLVDLWFAARHLLLVIPTFVLPLGGDPQTSETVPAVDVLVIVRDEPLHGVAVTLRSAIEVRGLGRLGVVDRSDRREVAELARSLGISVVRPDSPDVGLEPERSGAHLVLVPADSWVSVNVGALAGPALAPGDVGSVSLATTHHGVVSLVGTRGYQPPLFNDDRLAARFDSVGATTPTSGPLVCSKAALRAVGGIDWEADDPILVTRYRLADAGWRNRFVTAPGSYRMAPASEAEALIQRARRFADQVDARARSTAAPAGAVSTGPPHRAEVAARTRTWQRIVDGWCLIERWSVVPRIMLLAVPLLSVLFGALPVRPDLWSAVVMAGPWFVVGWVARQRASARRLAPFEPARISFRALATDMGLLVGSGGTERRVMAGQHLLMGVLLTLTGLSIAKLITSGLGEAGPGLLVAAGFVVVIPLFVRDAVTAYRQRRVSPRVLFEPQREGDVVQLSPIGVDVIGQLPVGSEHVLDVVLPLPDDRVSEHRLRARVRSHRLRNGATTSYLEFALDDEDDEDDVTLELLYFCAVTAPTMRWYGIELRLAAPVRSD